MLPEVRAHLVYRLSEDLNQKAFYVYLDVVSDSFLPAL